MCTDGYAVACQKLRTKLDSTIEKLAVFMYWEQGYTQHANYAYSHMTIISSLQIHMYIYAINLFRQPQEGSGTAKRITATLL